ncbi:MAG: sulfur oxidation c-type cytochrome SoxX [Candidatus Eremiobacteraeota bacterium]|nr:sulfur oxidation c-type cytochrome SoxX [Candidatus Eremiobacteraeota bacterium]
MKRSLALGALLLAVAGSAAAAGSAPAVVKDGDLPPYTIDAFAIAQPLAGTAAGDPVKGRQIALDRRGGNCLTCHAMPIEAADQGNVGPDLRGIGSRTSAGSLRLRIVNPKAFNPATIMPAFYRVGGLHDVAKDFEGKPMLNAQQVEDVVAFLLTFK